MSHASCWSPLPSSAEQYFLDIAPSPTADTVAVAFVDSVRQLVLVRIDEGPGRPGEEVFQSPRLSTVRIAWNEEGTALAIAHSDRCLSRSRQRGTVLRRMPAEIRWIGFDSIDRVLCQCGDTLVATSPGSSLIEVIHQGVLCVDARPHVIMAMRQTAGLRLCRLYGGAYEYRAWPLSVTTGCILRSLGNGQQILIAGQDHLSRGRSRVEVGLLEWSTGIFRKLFDGVVGLRFGEPALALEPWLDRSAIVRMELDDCMAVWELSVGKEPRRWSPANIEVFDFAVDPCRAWVAFTGARTNALAGSSRALFLSDRNGESVSTWCVVEGIVDRPIFSRSTGRLFYAWAAIGGSTTDLCALVLDRERAFAKPNMPASISVDSIVKADESRIQWVGYISGDAFRAPGVLYIQGPHRQLLDGPQISYFHHALFGILRDLATRGWLLLGGSGPGSAGRGRRVREEGANTWIDQARCHIDLGISKLCQGGASAVCLVGGSLAAMPILATLAARSDIAAAALISPVFFACGSNLDAWSYLFGEFVEPSESLRLAVKVRSPLFVAYGVRDEIAQAQMTSAVLDRLSALECIRIPDEGHVFTSIESWEKVGAALKAFLKQVVAQNAD
jgi:hypothetical protein